MYSHKVLVVDDNYVNRRVVKQIINATNHSCIGEASDGIEAIQLIEELQPTAITLDLNMPRRNGYEVLEILKDKYPKLPVIVITGERNEEKHQLAIKLGALHLIKKPFQPPYLTTRLEETPLVEEIYLPQPEISDDFELVIASETTERPHRNIEIRNAKTQIQYGEDKTPDYESGEFALTKEKILAQKDTIILEEVEEDELNNPQPKVETDFSKNDLLVVQPSTQNEHATTSTASDEEIPIEVKPFDHRSLWRIKSLEENNEPKQVIEAIEEKNQEPPPILTIEEQAIENEYDQKLFTLYEQEEKQPEPTQKISISENSSQQNPAIGDRFNSTIRPPMSKRRPLTADEQHRISQYKSDIPEHYVIHNAEEESDAGVKKGGLFARLFGRKK
ncbi:response regulator transcription factor [Lysinibacillus sp. UGB7]|uniref:response regulator transcription factor n=1 Tax=Lysinibacillus sp. UGB7 TaxID=3411039 RepID=UPI003B78F616